MSKFKKIRNGLVVGLAIISGIFIFINISFDTATSQEGNMTYNKLTPEEERVIVYKGTEAPFSGKFDSFFEKGTYTCKRCGAPLYKSDSKFNSMWELPESLVKFAAAKEAPSDSADNSNGADVERSKAN